MRAIVFDGQLRFAAHHSPPVPAEGDCVIQVHLAGICATDLHITRGYMDYRGILGHEMVGTVVEGPNAWKGKRVVGEINCVCRTCDMCQAGLSNHCRRRTVMGIVGRDGCFADRVALPERNLHEVPDVISDEEAVFIEPLAAACQVLAQCTIDRRTRACVIGPGRLGLLVAQVLNTTGCHLTVIGRNSEKLLLAEKKGIQAIHVRDVVPQKDLDLIVECSGSPDGLALAMQLIRPRGTIVLKTTSADAGSINLAPLVVDEVKLIGSRCGPFPEAINALARQAVDVRSLISKTFPIESGLEAFEAARSPKYLKVLLRIDPPR